MLNDKIKHQLDKCVLCWLATVDQQGQPNVSPKEAFTLNGDDTLLIANIASPQSVANIRTNPKVCVSAIDIFSQKGYKLKGIANIIEKTAEAFSPLLVPLTAIVGDQFPIHQIIEIKVSSIEPIIAPSYRLFPDTTEAEQIASAMKSYGVQPADPQCY